MPFPCRTSALCRCSREKCITPFWQRVFRPAFRSTCLLSRSQKPTKYIANVDEFGNGRRNRRSFFYFCLDPEKSLGCIHNLQLMFGFFALSYQQLANQYLRRRVYYSLLFSYLFCYFFLLCRVLRWRARSFGIVCLLHSRPLAVNPIIWTRSLVQLLCVVFKNPKQALIINKFTMFFVFFVCFVLVSFSLSTVSPICDI